MNEPKITAPRHIAHIITARYIANCITNGYSYDDESKRHEIEFDLQNKYSAYWYPTDESNADVESNAYSRYSRDAIFEDVKRGMEIKALAAFAPATVTMIKNSFPDVTLPIQPNGEMLIPVTLTIERYSVDLMLPGSNPVVPKKDTTFDERVRILSVDLRALEA